MSGSLIVHPQPAYAFARRLRRGDCIFLVFSSRTPWPLVVDSHLWSYDSSTHDTIQSPLHIGLEVVQKSNRICTLTQPAVCIREREKSSVKSERGALS